MGTFYGVPMTQSISFVLLGISSFLVSRISMNNIARFEKRLKEKEQEKRK